MTDRTLILQEIATSATTAMEALQDQIHTTRRKVYDATTYQDIATPEDFTEGHARAQKAKAELEMHQERYAELAERKRDAQMEMLRLRRYA